MEYKILNKQKQNHIQQQTLIKERNNKKIKLTV